LEDSKNVASDYPLPSSLLDDDDHLSVEALPLTSSISGSQADLVTSSTYPSSSSSSHMNGGSNGNGHSDTLITSSPSLGPVNPWASSSNSNSNSNSNRGNGLVRSVPSMSRVASGGNANSSSRDAIDVDSLEDPPLPSSIANDNDDDVVILSSSSSRDDHRNGNGNGNGATGNDDDLPLPASVLGDDDTFAVVEDNDTSNNGHGGNLTSTGGYGYPGSTLAAQRMAASTGGYGYPGSYPMAPVNRMIPSTTTLMSPYSHGHAAGIATYPVMPGNAAAAAAAGYSMEQYQQYHRQQLMAMNRQPRMGSTVGIIFSYIQASLQLPTFSCHHDAMSCFVYMFDRFSGQF
jgi:hypothetical protein